MGVIKKRQLMKSWRSYPCKDGFYFLGHSHFSPQPQSSPQGQFEQALATENVKTVLNMISIIAIVFFILSS